MINDRVEILCPNCTRSIKATIDRNSECPHCEYKISGKRVEHLQDGMIKDLGEYNLIEQIKKIAEHIGWPRIQMVSTSSKNCLNENIRV